MARYPLARRLLVLSVVSQFFLLSFGSKTEGEPRSKEETRGKSANFSSQDTYLKALEHSHAIKDQPRREYPQGPIYQAISTTTEANRKISVSNSYSTVNFGKDSEQGSYTKKYDPYVNFGPPDKENGLQESISFGPFTHPHGHAPSSYVSYGLPDKDDGLLQQEPPSFGPFTHPHSHTPSNYLGYGPPDKDVATGLPEQPPYGSFVHPHKPHYVPYGTSQPGESRGLGSLQATYSTSYPLPDLLPLPALLPAFDWPISLKINAYTLIKIVLKLVIFKIIVKFIGLVCLLLFLPKLIDKKGEHHDDDESRRLNDKDTLPVERLRQLASTVWSSVEHYEKINKNTTKKEKPCQNFGCQVKRLFISDETWNDYVGLFKSYLVEEEERARDVQ